MMRYNPRLEKIVSLVDEKGFLSVGELKDLCHASEMTIRRDLNTLAKQNRIQRTHGGAVSIHLAQKPLSKAYGTLPSVSSDKLLVDRIDVLVMTIIDPEIDEPLLDQFNKKNIPIVAEALHAPHEETLVSIDDYQAGYALGQWVGGYVREHLDGRANVLDLTHHLPNTEARSRGFIDGLRELLPETREPYSLNPQARFDTAYQLTHDAFNVYEDINVIFAINDTNACGAMKACEELEVDPEKLILVTVGLEGSMMRAALASGSYCKAGLAMFPELVGPVCVEAAIAAYNHQPLPAHLATPYAIITQENLAEFYTQDGEDWKLRWDTLRSRFTLPIDIDAAHRHARYTLPKRIGFTVRFIEHEWYQNLSRAMGAHAAHLGIEFEVIDAAQTMKDEVELRRREIARCAVEEIRPGDAVIIDGGPMGNYLADLLAGYKGITVISNSMPVLEILKTNPDIIVIAVGGAIRYSSQALVGPMAEAALREMRVDKLFLMVSGVSLNFGLSHPNISEVTIKQTMIRSAREVILLADHTCFGHESFIHVAPLNIVHKLITDDALPASFRLELNKLGIQVVLAGM